MKRSVFIAIFAIMLFLSACGRPLYSDWKDTVHSFGDGTYQIMHHAQGETEIQVLMNCKHNQCVLSKIEKYKQVDRNIYFIGSYDKHNILCVLNIDSNLLKYYIKNNKEDFVMIYAYDMEKDNQIRFLSNIEEFSEKEKENLTIISAK